MDKAPEAFRTISEVADELEVPKHVLRFWEAKFAQLNKAVGGRAMLTMMHEDDAFGLFHEADKARFQAMLQNLGGGGLMAKPEPEPKRTIVRKGSAVFNGFKCERVEVRKGAKLTTDLCFGQPGDLGVAAEDYAAAKGMVDMANRFREHAAKMAQQFGGSMPDMGPDDVPGIPVAVSQDGNQMMLIKVEKRSDDIGLPSGYTPRALPSFPGMQ